MLEKLKEIIDEIMLLEGDLYAGDVEFSYDRLAMAMKPGNPADILDDIVSEIFWDLEKDVLPETQRVVNVYHNMEAFYDSFKVEEMYDILLKLEKLFEDNDIDPDDYWED